MRKVVALVACLLLGMVSGVMADQSTAGLSVDSSIFFEGVSQDLGADASAEYLNGRGRFTFGYTKGDYKGVLKLEIGEFTGDVPLGTSTARDARIVELKHLYIAGPIPYTPLTLSAGLQDVTLGNGLVMSEDYVALNFGTKVGAGDLGLAFVSLTETMFADADASAVALYYTGALGSVTIKPYLIYGRFADNYASEGAAISGDGNLFWIGAPVSMAMGPLTIDAEFDYLSGTKSDLSEISGEFRDVDYDSYALWVKAGYDAGKLQLSAMAGYGTGDDDATDDENTAFTPIDEDLTIDIVWEDNLGGGLSGDGIRGLLFARVGADFAATDALTVGAAVVFEQFAEGAEKGIGTELDFTAAYTVSESTVLTAGLGYLFAGDAFDDDMYMAYWNLEFNY